MTDRRLAFHRAIALISGSVSVMALMGYLVLGFPSLRSCPDGDTVSGWTRVWIPVIPYASVVLAATAWASIWLPTSLIPGAVPTWRQMQPVNHLTYLSLLAHSMIGPLGGLSVWHAMCWKAYSRGSWGR